MTDTSNTTFLRPLLNVVRVRKWIIVQTLVCLTVAAAVASALEAAEYQASAQVLISRTNLGNVLTGTNDPAAAEFDFNRVVQTQANLARTPRVAKRTLAAMNLDPSRYTAFLDQSSVATSPNNDLLTFTVNDGDRRQAIRLAGQYARQFVAYKRATSTQNLVGLRNDLAREYAGLDPKSSAAQENRVQFGRVQNLLTLGDSSVSVVQTPSAAVKTKPRIVRNIILGIVLGAVLGMGLAFLRDALDTRLRTSGEVEEYFELPLLGRLPKPPWRLAKSSRLATIDDPTSPDAEHFRVLRSGLSLANVDHRAQTILISSAVPAEGKSTTIANLAVVMARAGQNVVLADFDFRRPSLERFFDLPRGPGVVDVMVGEATLADALRTVDLAPHDEAATPGGDANGSTSNGSAPQVRASVVTQGTLRVLTTGELPLTVGEFVTSRAVDNLVQALKQSADVVLVDAPPLLAFGDAVALSDYVDAMIFVARLGVVRRNMVEEVRRVLAAMPTPILGIVITDATVEPGGYGYGYGYGYYGDGPQARPPSGRTGSESPTGVS